MTAAAGANETRGSRRVSPRVVGLAVMAAVIAAVALDTEYRTPGEVTAGGREAFDPAAYGAETFPRVASTIEESAVPLSELHAALRDDLDAAGERYGARHGTGPFTFSTSGEGVAGDVEGTLLPVRVKGVPRSARVSLQVGPAINGTAIRDAVGFIEFGQFTNQVEYAAAGTALNEQVKRRVLEGIDPASLEGERVTFTGAFSALTPDVITITPVSLEAGG